MTHETTIISLGGSIIAPNQVDTAFLKAFRELVVGWLDEKVGRRVVLITGGGAPARVYQEAYRSVTGQADTEAQDWIGIAATRLNGALVKAVFGADCTTAVVTDPTAEFEWTSRVLVAAGWKPGFSTDFDAVMIAERFGAGTVINLSNIAQVYTGDPRKNPNAKPLERVTWPEFQRIVGTEWKPGLNAPFDPIATTKAAGLGLTVYMAAGADLPNLGKILRGQAFFGTVISGTGR
ncbi:MAG: UMP kinase [Spirochaetales bacterium]